MARANQAVRDAVRSVLDAAGEAGRERIGRDLLDMAAMLSGEPRLRTAFTDPSLAIEAKRALADQLLSSRVAAGAMAALTAVIENQRLQGRELVDVVEDVASQTLLDVADAQGSLADVEDELFAFARMTDGNADLYAALTEPGLPGERKRALADDLLGDRANPLSAALLGYYVEQGRGGHLRDIAEDLATEAAAQRGQVMAEVRSAVPLDDVQRRRLADRLSEIVGRPVQLRLVVDPSVVGSLSVRIGDEVYDGTVKRQLELAGERLGAA
jgi:F-type H+-transporting ATPase subunit delta